MDGIKIKDKKGESVVSTTPKKNQNVAYQKLNQQLCVGVDFEKYQHFLDGSDLTDEEKQQVVQALWDIIVNFVDLGIGVHPIQQTGSMNNDINKSALETFQAEFETVANIMPIQHMKGIDA